MHTINLKLVLFLIPIILKAGTINESLIEYVCIDPSAENYFASADPNAQNWDDSYLNPNSNNYNYVFAQSVEIDNSLCEYTTTETCQTIDFPAGWSMFSTYIESTEPHVSDVLSDLIAENNLIIVKRYTGGVYFPEWLYTDGVVDIAQEEGYLIKLQEDQTINICGSQLLPDLTPINLYEGWSFISFIRDTPQDAIIVLNDIAEEIIIVKDSYGMAYLPSWNYNGIGNFEPGQGYQIKMNSEQILIYDAND